MPRLESAYVKNNYKKCLHITVFLLAGNIRTLSRRKEYELYLYKVLLSSFITRTVLNETMHDLFLVLMLSSSKKKSGNKAQAFLEEQRRKGFFFSYVSN